MTKRDIVRKVKRAEREASNARKWLVVVARWKEWPSDALYAGEQSWADVLIKTAREVKEKEAAARAANREMILFFRARARSRGRS